MAKPNNATRHRWILHSFFVLERLWEPSMKCFFITSSRLICCCISLVMVFASCGAVARSAPSCKYAFNVGSSIQKDLIKFSFLMSLGNGVHLSETKVDINNDGRIDDVFSVSAFSTAFTGSYLIAFTKPHSDTQSFISYIKSNYFDPDHDAEAKAQKLWNAEFISTTMRDQSQSYVDTDLFVSSGRIYILITNNGGDRWIGSIEQLKPNDSILTVCQAYKNGS